MIIDVSSTKKILIVGLENSGKSSIVLSLSRRTNLNDYFSLKPTQSFNLVKVKMQDKTFGIWDFGGQKKFRDEFLANITKYTSEFDKMIYVIDVQDTKKYDLALEYLETILNSLEIKEESYDLSIFLHKSDPDLETNKAYPEIREKSSALIGKIRDLVPEHFSCKIFRTSIFTVFNKELVP